MTVATNDIEQARKKVDLEKASASMYLELLEEMRKVKSLKAENAKLTSELEFTKLEYAYLYHDYRKLQDDNQFRMMTEFK